MTLRSDLGEDSALAVLQRVLVLRRNRLRSNRQAEDKRVKDFYTKTCLLMTVTENTVGVKFSGERPDCAMEGAGLGCRRVCTAPEESGSKLVTCKI